MASPLSAFCFFCLFLRNIVLMTESQLSSSAHGKTRFISAQVGGKVTLTCFHVKDVSARVYWYKHTLGKKPNAVSLFFKYNLNSSFIEEFRDNPRFTLDTENGKNHLTITDLHISDSGTYYCIQYLYKLTFLESIIISVKGSGVNIKPLVQQLTSETIQPGGSVMLSCTVHTGTCDEEHSVYWFKDSEDSHPEIIYTYGGIDDQCERKPDMQTDSCVYNLPMRGLNLSHAGTYYCAVASCGHILFGNGTKLDFEGKEDSPALVYFLSGALTFSTILNVLQAYLLCKSNKRKRYKSTESQSRFPGPSTTNTEDYQDADGLHYAALNVNMPKRFITQRNNTETECIYAGINKCDASEDR